MVGEMFRCFQALSPSAALPSTPSRPDTESLLGTQCPSHGKDGRSADARSRTLCCFCPQELTTVAKKTLCVDYGCQGKEVLTKPGSRERKSKTHITKSKNSFTGGWTAGSHSCCPGLDMTFMNRRADRLCLSWALWTSCRSLPWQWTPSGAGRGHGSQLRSSLHLV